MPAGAGTRRYEKRELRFGTANWHGGFCHAPPRPLRGTSPRRYIFSFRHRQSWFAPNPARFAGGTEPASRLITTGHIPRSIVRDMLFIGIAHAGCRSRHHQGMKSSGVLVICVQRMFPPPRMMIAADAGDPDLHRCIWLIQAHPRLRWGQVFDQCYIPLAPPPLDSGPVSGYGASALRRNHLWPCAGRIRG